MRMLKLQLFQLQFICKFLLCTAEWNMGIAMTQDTISSMLSKIYYLAIFGRRISTSSKYYMAISMICYYLFCRNHLMKLFLLGPSFARLVTSLFKFQVCFQVHFNDIKMHKCYFAPFSWNLISNCISFSMMLNVGNFFHRMNSWQQKLTTYDKR